MLCHHTGKRPLGCCVLQSSSRLKCPQPVRIIPGIFLGFLLQRVSAKPHLLVKYGVAAALPLLAVKCKRRRTYALCSLAFVGYMFALAGLLTALFSE